MTGFEKPAKSDVAGTPAQDEWMRAADAVAILKPILTTYAARIRICERALAGIIRARAEQFHVDQRVAYNQDIPKGFWWAKGHQALEQDWAAGDFSTWIDHTVHLKAFGITFARADIEKLLPPPNGAKAEVIVARNTEDDETIRRLNALVPSAALSYTQAILDLSDDSRVSFRGPALELREALRELLDHLAPDDDVMAMPGYTQEKEKTGPTMRQKVRFIIKKRNFASSDAPEEAATAFEEAIARLTRTVYVLSSKATHVAGERQAVVQLRRYVVAIFHEILET